MRVDRYRVNQQEIELLCMKRHKKEANNDVMKYQNTIETTTIESLQLNNYPGITLYVKRKFLCLYDVAKFGLTIFIKDNSTKLRSDIMLQVHRADVLV